MSTEGNYLLDTSVLIRFFHPQDPLQSAADGLLAEYQNGSVALILLDLSYYELVNAEVRRLGLPWEEVQADLRTLSGLKLPTLRIDEELAIETAKVAEETGLSGYDAAFVAASAFVQSPLVTTDRGIIERASGYQVVHLADLAI